MCVGLPRLPPHRLDLAHQPSSLAGGCGPPVALAAGSVPYLRRHQRATCREAHTRAQDRRHRLRRDAVERLCMSSQDGGYRFGPRMSDERQKAPAPVAALGRATRPARDHLSAPRAGPRRSRRRSLASLPAARFRRLAGSVFSAEIKVAWTRCLIIDCCRQGSDEDLCLRLKIARCAGLAASRSRRVRRVSRC